MSFKNNWGQPNFIFFFLKIKFFKLSNLQGDLLWIPVLEFSPENPRTNPIYSGWSIGSFSPSLNYSLSRFISTTLQIHQISEITTLQKILEESKNFVNNESDFYEMEKKVLDTQSQTSEPGLEKISFGVTYRISDKIFRYL